MRLALLIYAAGAALGLMFTDDRPAARVALALLWPIGPLAFAFVISVLLLAAAVIFPVFGVVAVSLGAAGAWWLLR